MISPLLALDVVHAYTRLMATVSHTLRRALESCGATRYAVSKATEIPESTLSRFVVGKKHLRGETIDRLCKYLGLALTPTPKSRAKGGT